jgi:adenylate cyclase
VQAGCQRFDLFAMISRAVHHYFSKPAFLIGKKELLLVLRQMTALALVTFISHQTTAQDQHKLDSLNKVLAYHPADTTRVQALIEGFATEYYLSDPDKAISYCEEARQLSEKLSYKKGSSMAYGWLAFLHEQQGDIQKALNYNFRSLKVLREIGKKKEEAAILNNIAAIYKDQGKIEEALSYNWQSLKIKREINDQVGIAASYNNIGFIYQHQGNVKEALEYYFRGLRLQENLKDLDGVATSWHNIGVVYEEQGHYKEALKNLQKSLSLRELLKDKYGEAYSLNGIGNLLEKQGKLGQALEHYQQALQLRQELKDQQGVAYSHRNIGVIYERQHQPELALRYFQQSLQGFREVGDKRGIATVLNKISRIYEGQGKTEQAGTLARESLSLANKLGYPAEIRDAAEVLSGIYREQGQWQNALQMKDLFVQMRDSVQNIANRKVSLQQQFQYEFDKKEAVLKAEQARKDALAQEVITLHQLERNASIIGGILLLVFLGLLYHRFRYVSRTKQIIQRERDRSDQLLLNILPAETAEELKQFGEAQAHQYEVVTVLFADIKNFTKLAESLSPREVVSTLHEYFQGFDQIVGAYGLEKIKTIGDAYLCAGGLSDTAPVHPVQVVRAAMEMQKMAQRLMVQRSREGLPFFELRMGIHTGPVVAGVVGIKKFAYDIWGDTVNTAARMEQSGVPGRINISGATYELVKEFFVCSFRGRIEAKNKGELEMYFVERVLEEKEVPLLEEQAV